ncbi:MAG TPA: APC family permease [Stellaceae bacterium]|nr:APC family permease [Stellaceae bacterium]
MDVVGLLIGRRLANREGEGRKIGALEGFPAMGLDGLSSAAYGPEAALSVLIPAGAAGLGAIRPIMAAILVLLLMLFASYWQTIEAYPNNAGSYSVAKENLGANAGLLAATALMIDYMLNVAVGISAGVGALTSALPLLHPYTLPLCLVVLALITIVNLRGTLEAGLAFSIPTYLFVASFGGLLLLGLWKAAGGSPAPVVPPPAVAAGGAGITLWLLLRAFASGCTAMTGVEAVSNGIGAFREPTVHYAHRTLAAIVLTLVGLLVAIVYLTPVYHIAAMDQTRPGYQTVLAQLAAAVVGRGLFFFVAIGSLLAVLCLSANTSFVAFPRLCRLLAQDGYLPRAFTAPGRRLVYTAGILWLALGAGLLLAVFGGITDRLIPLFAVGAFLAFTMSQAGMAVHWRRRRRAAEPHGEPQEPRGGLLWRMGINGTGAAATGAALLVILAAKFVEGAWITIVAIPCVLLLLKVIKRYYDGIDLQLRAAGAIDLRPQQPPVVVTAIARWDRLADKAVRYSLLLSPDVHAVHLTRLEGPEAEEALGQLRRQWREDVERPARAAGLAPPQLVMLPSPYRSFAGRVLRYIAALKAHDPDRPIAVVVPELVREHWWDYLLQGWRGARLRATLLRHGGPNLAVVIVPWAREPPHPETVIATEEPASKPPRHRA